MMTEAVIVAIVTGAFTLAGTWLMNKKKSQDDAIKEAQREQMQADRLASIEHKLDIHNGYAEKLGDISQSMVAMQKDIEYLKEKNK